MKKILLLSSLPPLKDIIDDLEPKANDSICSDEDLEMLQNSIYTIIDEYITNNVEQYKREDFDDLIEEYIYNILQITYVDLHDLFYDIDINDIIQNTMLIYFQSKNNPRSYKNTFDTYEDVNKIQSRIDYVSKIPQAPQNSEEWYKYRYNRLCPCFHCTF